MIHHLSPCVDNLNQKEHFVKDCNSLISQVSIHLCVPRVRFPCSTNSKSLPDFQWKQQKYKNGRQTKHFTFSLFLFSLFVLLDQPTTSAHLKTSQRPSLIHQFIGV